MYGISDWRHFNNVTRGWKKKHHSNSADFQQFFGKMKRTPACERQKMVNSILVSALLTIWPKVVSLIHIHTMLREAQLKWTLFNNLNKNCEFHLIASVSDLIINFWEERVLLNRMIMGYTNVADDTNTARQAYHTGNMIMTFANHEHKIICGNEDSLSLISHVYTPVGASYMLNIKTFDVVENDALELLCAGNNIAYCSVGDLVVMVQLNDKVVYLVLPNPRINGGAALLMNDINRISNLKYNHVVECANLIGELLDASVKCEIILGIQSGLVDKHQLMESFDQSVDAVFDHYLKLRLSNASIGGRMVTYAHTRQDYELQMVNEDCVERLFLKKEMYDSILMLLTKNEFDLLKKYSKMGNAYAYEKITKVFKGLVDDMRAKIDCRLAACSNELNVDNLMSNKVGLHLSNVDENKLLINHVLGLCYQKECLASSGLNYVRCIDQSMVLIENSLNAMIDATHKIDRMRRDHLVKSIIKGVSYDMDKKQLCDEVKSIYSTDKMREGGIVVVSDIESGLDAVIVKYGEDKISQILSMLGSNGWNKRETSNRSNCWIYEILYCDKDHNIVIFMRIDHIQRCRKKCFKSQFDVSEFVYDNEKNEAVASLLCAMLNKSQGMKHDYSAVVAIFFNMLGVMHKKNQLSFLDIVNCVQTVKNSFITYMNIINLDEYEIFQKQLMSWSGFTDIRQIAELCENFDDALTYSLTNFLVSNRGVHNVVNELSQFIDLKTFMGMDLNFMSGTTCSSDYSAKDDKILSAICSMQASLKQRAGADDLSINDNDEFKIAQPVFVVSNGGEVDLPEEDIIEHPLVTCVNTLLGQIYNIMRKTVR